MALPDGVVAGADGKPRCAWPGADPMYVSYHDREWGRPVADDRRLFEKLCLEGFQSGLSWLTILRKRENFRTAFAGFDFAEVARFGPADVERCLADAGIVRHRGKIESVINNARRALELVEAEGSLAAFIWRFEPQPESRPARLDRALSPAPATIGTSGIRPQRRHSRAERSGDPRTHAEAWILGVPLTRGPTMTTFGVINDSG